MKSFVASFFDTENFLVSQKTFDYRATSSPAEEMHVCFNVNDPYFRLMGASAISIMENNKSFSFVIHIFTDGCSEENEQKVRQMAEKWHCKCIIYVLDMKPFEDFHIKVARFSRITYGRIYMPMILKGVTKRFIYVDADAMCIKSLENLWHTDMQGAAMGAVMEQPASVAYRVKFLHLASGKYFNDGIMLVDVDAWINQHITETAFSYQCEPKERFLGQSQDVLNLVFDGRNYFLPVVYNMYGGGGLDKGDSVIIHWTGRRKPWQMVLTDFDAQWREYNRLSPWETITNILPIKKPENYHDFQQWGRYQKKKGNTLGYIKGIFWYSVLRIQYKLHI